MRKAIFTPGPHPHVVIEIRCDTDLLIQMVVDGELTRKDVAATLTSAVEEIVGIVQRGLAKKAAAPVDG